MIEPSCGQMPNIPPEDSAGPLVNNVDLSSDGKFAFVEFRDEPICTLALTLFDKMEVCGRALNVGRPRGYVDPTGAVPGVPGLPFGGMADGAPGMGLSAPVSIGNGGGLVPPPPPAPPPPPPTNIIKLDGMLVPDILSNDEECATAPFRPPGALPIVHTLASPIPLGDPRRAGPPAG